MCLDNQTEVTEFLLLGFRGLYKYKFLFFILFLFSYLVILNGNLLIIVLVSTNDHLKIPMFIFLKHLAIADVLITTTIMPMMLNIILLDEKEVPVRGCIAQLYFYFAFAFVQCFLLAVMSYDRYLAICKPMHYNSIMQPHVCLNIVLGIWFFTFVLSCEIILFWQLEFCGRNIIDNFICDFGPILELATSDTSLILSVDPVSVILVNVAPFAFIIISYICIIFTILTLSSTSGRKKAFSTCSSHLAAVCLYYGGIIMVYMVPSDDHSLSTNKFMPLLFIVVTPMMNPIIYSLKNQKIRRTIQQSIKKFKEST